MAIPARRLLFTNKEENEDDDLLPSICIFRFTAQVAPQRAVCITPRSPFRTILETPRSLPLLGKRSKGLQTPKHPAERLEQHAHQPRSPAGLPDPRTATKGELYRRLRTTGTCFPHAAGLVCTKYENMVAILTSRYQVAYTRVTTKIV